MSAKRITCEEFENLLDFSYFDELTADEMRQFLDHRATCPAHSAEALESAHGLPKGAIVAGSPAHGLPSSAERVRQLLARVDAEESDDRSGAGSSKGPEPRIELSSSGRRTTAAPDTRQVFSRILRLPLRRYSSIAASIAALAIVAACTTFSHRASSWDGSGRVVMHDFDGLEWFPSWTLTENLRMFKRAAAAMHSGKDTPFTRAMRLLDDGRTLDALLAIEEALDPSKPVQPEDADVLPLLARALRMQAGLADGPGNPNEDYRSFALLVAARLLREHPDTTPSAVQASANYRASLVRTLDAPQANRPLLDRLHGLTALGGCGTVDLIPSLGSWAADSHRSGEERRLCVRAAETIVRRSLQCAAVGTIDLNAAQRFIATLAAVPTEDWPGMPDDIVDLIRATGAASRTSDAAGFRSFIEGLSAAWLQDSRRCYVFAAAQAKGAKDVIKAKSPEWLRNDSGTVHFGWVCGLLGDSQFTSEMQDRASAAQHAGAFKFGVNLASDELQGKRLDYDYSSESDAKAPRVSYGGPAVESVQKNRDADAKVVAQWLFVGSAQHDVSASGQGALADGPAYGVAADSIFTGSSDSPDQSHVLFATPGRSLLTLKFKLAEWAPLELELVQIKRADQQWAYDGTAMLSISLDGLPVVVDAPVVSETWHSQTFRIELQQTEPGIHELRIRLSERATTSCNLMSVRVRTL